MHVDKFDLIFNTNVRPMIALSKLCLPHLKQQKGAIVNVSSILGKRPAFRNAFYSMSKAAVDMFTKCLSLEVGPHGVRVNAVQPGSIPTGLLTASGVSEDTQRRLMQRRLHLTPLGRHGTVQEVANVIAFLASKEANYLNGISIPIDGGVLIIPQ